MKPIATHPRKVNSSVADSADLSTPSSNVTDRAIALMDNYCAGAAPAFHALYVLLAPRILAYLTCLGRDQALAEELLQETFINLHRARECYVRGADPIPWLYTIAHHTYVDAVRGGCRARATLMSDANSATEALTELDGASDGSRAQYDEGPMEGVFNALERLPSSQRLAVVLTTIQGKSMAEAATILGTTPGAVRVLAHRGYVTLHEIRRSLDAE